MNGAVCEPVVYMMDRFVIGGFFPVPEGRGAGGRASSKKNSRSDNTTT